MTAPSTPRPDFFLVGAPKCGTTAMYRYLKQHPDVFMAKKERHYFGSDLRPDDYAGPHGRDPEWYLAHFEGGRGARRVGEASVWYFGSQCAAREIHAFDPEAQIIVMLRNPVEMLYSMYSMFLWVRDLAPGGVLDPATLRPMSFEAALETQDARRAAWRAEDDPEVRAGKRERRIFHTDSARYADALERYFDVFGRERVHVILFEDFKADTEGAYRTLVEWLGLNAEFVPDLEVHNPNRQLKSTRLNWLLRTRDLPLRQALRSLLPGSMRHFIGSRLMQMNVQHGPRPPMRADTRAWLEAHFRDDVERTGALLGRDLASLWLGGARDARERRGAA